MTVKKIKDIYPGYFQKSKVFLHPALKLKRGSSVTPIETYFNWENHVETSDGKLVELYHLRNDNEFLHYEEKYLLGNPLFHDYKEVDEEKAVYIFDFADHINDFTAVVSGKYSLLSQELKTKIKNYYGPSTDNYAFIDSYLYPHKYLDEYAKFLTCKPEDIPQMHNILTEVGELCSKPDFNKEVLKMSIKALDLKNL